MNTAIKKIRILAIVGLSFILLDCIVGVGVLFSGLMYHGFEKDKAVLKLELLKSTNKEFYDRITGNQDSLAKADFYSQYQLHGKPILVSVGFLMLVFALINVIPLALMVYITMSEKEEKLEAEAVPEKKEGENASEF